MSKYENNYKLYNNHGINTNEHKIDSEILTRVHEEINKEYSTFYERCNYQFNLLLNDIKYNMVNGSLNPAEEGFAVNIIDYCHSIQVLMLAKYGFIENAIETLENMDSTPRDNTLAIMNYEITFPTFNDETELIAVNVFPRFFDGEYLPEETFQIVENYELGLEEAIDMEQLRTQYPSIVDSIEEMSPETRFFGEITNRFNRNGKDYMIGLISYVSPEKPNEFKLLLGALIHEDSIIYCDPFQPILY